MFLLPEQDLNNILSTFDVGILFFELKFLREIPFFVRTNFWVTLSPNLNIDEIL